MTQNQRFEQWMETSGTLSELVERADRNDVPTSELATFLSEHGWSRDVPADRVLELLRREKERLDSFNQIDVSASSRAARYMDLADLELLSGHEFEHVLAEVLRRVEGEARVTEATGDQGVDVVWFRESETVGIQAKAYDLSNPVGNSAVQEIYTGATVRQSEYSMDTAAVVTTSRYTDGAEEAAEQSEVILYGRDHLRHWLTEAELDMRTMGDLLEEV